eukprot:m.12121 g.12121  ORF g.12121 m.12121 type:complete len:50 (-) comp6763_c0_seq1:433-582(-)
MITRVSSVVRASCVQVEELLVEEKQLLTEQQRRTQTDSSLLVDLFSLSK